MAVRTTANAVEGLFDEINDDLDMDTFIVVANNLLNRVCIDDDGEYLYDAETMELIERYLAAHFYAITDKQLAVESAKGVSAHYQHKIDLVLMVTHWGQMACVLDISGKLAQLSKDTAEGNSRATTSIKWLGTDEDTESGEVP